MKNDLLIFSEQTREELIEIILKQRKRIEDLEKIVQEKQKSQAHKEFLKNLRLAQKVKRPKSPGQKAGHEGFTRIKPDQIDHIVESKLSSCPDCHESLSKSQEVTQHIQEDIIPAHREVTLFKKHRYWCQGCKKMVTAPYAPEEVPHGYLGPNILVQTVLLKYHHGLPYNKIKELFGSLCQFEVSEGALAGALQRISEWLGVEMGVILEAIRSSPNIHADETGWKISGVNHWLWAFVNERLALYQIAKSRGSKIPKEVLTGFKGILTTDFYAAYNMLAVKKQKCLVHLMREMHGLFIKDQTPEFIKYYKRLKRIIEDALKLKKLHETLEPDCYQRRIKLLEKRL
ncbi:MAG: IS66 family transposase, partial [Candidatus Omnitrophica bacterium]|nr:IS66 family transposase [Candidatus Omnitrophota bacterium]